MPNKRSLSLSFAKAKRSCHGFTLIELMVAISIVAILSTVGMSFYGTAQKSARDSKRKQDINAIATALEIYKQANGFYPKFNWIYSKSGGTWIAGLNTNYINQLPKDPKQVPSSNLCTPWDHADCYTYGYYGDTWGGATTGEDFILVTNLENRNDPQSGQGILYGSTIWGNVQGFYVVSN